MNRSQPRSQPRAETPPEPYFPLVVVFAILLALAFAAHAPAGAP